LPPFNKETRSRRIVAKIETRIPMIKRQPVLQIYHLASAALFILAFSAFRFSAQKVQLDELTHGQTQVVLPGDATLDTRHFVDRSRRLEFQGLSLSGDSVTMRIPLERSEHVIAGSAGMDLLIAYRYAPPTSTGDSLVVNRASLAPRHETLRVSKRSIDLEYTAASVDIVTRWDSGGTIHHLQPLTTPAFAFNEREQVIRSLPLAAGYRAILPLFSEIDEHVELDSVAVVGRGRTTAGASVWRVRFADPAIVVTYDIDVTTRQAVTESVFQRQSARTMRYLQVGIGLRGTSPDGSSLSVNDPSQ
jgi:hypothetical protein